MLDASQELKRESFCLALGMLIEAYSRWEEKKYPALSSPDVTPLTENRVIFAQ